MNSEYKELEEIQNILLNILTILPTNYNNSSFSISYHQSKQSITDIAFKYFCNLSHDQPDNKQTNIKHHKYVLLSILLSETNQLLSISEYFIFGETIEKEELNVNSLYNNINIHLKFTDSQTTTLTNIFNNFYHIFMETK